MDANPSAEAPSPVRGSDAAEEAGGLGEVEESEKSPAPAREWGFAPLKPGEFSVLKEALRAHSSRTC